MNYEVQKSKAALFIGSRYILWKLETFLVKVTLGKKMTSRKCRAYRAISYKIWGQFTPFKTTWT